METQAPITVFGSVITHLNHLTVGVLDAYEAKSGKTLSSLDCAERRVAAGELNTIGFFGLRGAAIAYAKRAKITKVTAYKDIHVSLWGEDTK